MAGSAAFPAARAVATEVSIWVMRALIWSARPLGTSFPCSRAWSARLSRDLAVSRRSDMCRRLLAKLAKSPSMLSTRSRRLAMAVEPSPMRLAMFCNCFCISAAVWPKLGRFSLDSALETTPTARCACWRARMVSWLLYPESSSCNAWILSPKSS